MSSLPLAEDLKAGNCVPRNLPGEAEVAAATSLGSPSRRVIGRAFKRKFSGAATVPTAFDVR